MTNDNKIVNGLWIGEKLSPLEELTLRSFLFHGHEFHLWVYFQIKTLLPEGVVVEDANRIIPFQEVFSRKRSDPACGGVGRGSYGSPFSDLFRYKLLHERGGWWTDMDVTCLKPLAVGAPWFFREHPTLHLVGTVMKCPPGSSLMKEAYKETRHLCNEKTADWLLPNRILSRLAEKEGLLSYRVPGSSNPDIWHETVRYIRQRRDAMHCVSTLSEQYLFFHWMNEEWRVRGIAKTGIAETSALGTLMKKYGVENFEGTWRNRVKNRVKLLLAGMPSLSLVGMPSLPSIS